MATHVKFSDSEESSNQSESEEIENESIASDEEELQSIASDKEELESSDDEKGPKNPISKGMTMEELIKIRENIGTKAFAENLVKRNHIDPTIKLNKSKTKRANKNRPLEVPMVRKLAQRKKFFVNKKSEEKSSITSIRDPRFDDLSGKLDITAWKKNYDFISDQRSHEKKALKRALKEETDSKTMKKLKMAVQRIDNQEREIEKKEKEIEFRRKEKNQAISSLQLGNAPKYVSKKEKNSFLNQSYLDKLKKENKLDKYYARKEKKKQTREYKQFGGPSY